MEWVRRNDHIHGLKELIEHNTGLPIREFMSPHESPILNLDDAVDYVKSVIEEKERLSIIGDYDADGITASAILYMAIALYDAEYARQRLTVRLPKRFSEGYGLNESIIEEIPEGAIITVDNGISANGAIDLARKKGLSIAILDHHVCTGELPNADVIVNPHVFSHEGDFTGFSGAGLAYRFSQRLLNRCVPTLAAFAAIGTVADVVPLIRDNRLIVQEGLQAINEGNITLGLSTLIRKLNFFVVDSETVAFYIAPCLNAPGRLNDDGANVALNLILNDKNPSEAEDKAAKIIDLNRARKKLVKQGLRKVEKLCNTESIPIIAYAPNISEGIVGLIAGKLSEKYNVPSLVLTDSMEPGVIKGSARSFGSYDIISAMKKADKLFLKLGGHRGAAGCSLLKVNLETLKSELQRSMTNFIRPPIDKKYYDLLIPAENINTAFVNCQVLEPFGEHNPKPIFMITNFTIEPVCGYPYRTFGTGKAHIRLFREDCTAIGFDMASKYLEKPVDILTLYATIGFDVHCPSTIQLMLYDIKR